MAQKPTIKVDTEYTDEANGIEGKITGRIDHEDGTTHFVFTPDHTEEEGDGSGEVAE